MHNQQVTFTVLNILFLKCTAPLPHYCCILHLHHYPHHVQQTVIWLCYFVRSMIQHLLTHSFLQTYYYLLIHLFPQFVLTCLLIHVLTICLAFTMSLMLSHPHSLNISHLLIPLKSCLFAHLFVPFNSFTLAYSLNMLLLADSVYKWPSVAFPFIPSKSFSLTHLLCALKSLTYFLNAHSLSESYTSLNSFSFVHSLIS